LALHYFDSSSAEEKRRNPKSRICEKALGYFALPFKLKSNDLLPLYIILEWYAIKARAWVLVAWKCQTMVVVIIQLREGK